MSQDLAFRAMQFATEKHSGQVRKYTGVPYVTHLAEVAGIVAAVDAWPEAIAVAWLHDVMEDQEVSRGELNREFGSTVAYGVEALSDMERGTRAERKAMSRARLAAAGDWIQTIKCADLISNTSSIVMHDPEFAVIYLEEKRALLEVMTLAHPGLRAIAMSQVAAKTIATSA